MELYANPDKISYVTANVLDEAPMAILNLANAERLDSYHASVEVISSNLVLHTVGKEQVEGML